MSNTNLYLEYVASPYPSGWAEWLERKLLDARAELAAGNHLYAHATDRINDLAAEITGLEADNVHLEANVAELHDRLDGICTWSEDGEGNWDTYCGQLWVFSGGGTPEDNEAVYCHHCGKRIAAVKYQESEEE
jgi:hypothetical protein